MQVDEDLLQSMRQLAKRKKFGDAEAECAWLYARGGGACARLGGGGGHAC